jgi:exodeoxyribonuclease VIII
LTIVKNNCIFLQKLSDFIEMCGGKDIVFVWGNSARFDLGLLHNAYQKCNMPYPWDFRKERCVRTLLALKPQAKTVTQNVGVAHNPVDDCLFQIKYCTEVWKSLNHNP